MKINILFEFKEGAWGGGNQFLKALRDFFIEKNIYENDPNKADIILFNSHQKFKSLIKIKLKYPEKLFIHRIDGPIFKIRNKDLEIDKMIYKINEYFADGTIFQSKWSQNENLKLGLKGNINSTIIINAPNSKLFHPLKNKKLGKKLKIIITSWSSNINKGFDVYKWLDVNLNFKKYKIIFVGNSPIKFKNIQYLKPLSSKKLGHLLKEQDIFITASKKDPCSNSLIEALHCKLPSIGFNDGGHPEIIGEGGEIFNFKEEIPELLEKIRLNYLEYSKKIELPNINEVGERYIQFIFKIYEQSKSNQKIINKVKYYKCLLYINYYSFISKINKVLKILWNKGIRK